MDADAAYLLQTIRRYGVEHRSTEVRNVLPLLERGRIAGNLAKAYLYRWQGLIDEQKRRPNLLWRAPEHHELYPDHPPHLVIGRLAEDPDIPLGFFLEGAFHHILVGTSGSGKTMAIRSLVRTSDKISDAT